MGREYELRPVLVHRGSHEKIREEPHESGMEALVYVISEERFPGVQRVFDDRCEENQPLRTCRLLTEPEPEAHCLTGCGLYRMHSGDFGPVSCSQAHSARHDPGRRHEASIRACLL